VNYSSPSANVNRPIFPNVVFSSYLEFRTMDKVQKPRDFQCYTRSTSSEPFRFYRIIVIGDETEILYLQIEH
jgi:hypothetical protein